MYPKKAYDVIVKIIEFPVSTLLAMYPKCHVAFGVRYSPCTPNAELHLEYTNLHIPQKPSVALLCLSKTRNGATKIIVNPTQVSEQMK